MSAFPCGSLGISSGEFASLQTFFLSTGGVNWNWGPLSSGLHWNFSNLESPYSNFDLLRPCGNPFTNSSKWQGVTCELISNNGNCSLSRIQLSQYRLKGIIPQNLQFLNLQTLDLHSNQLFGSVPNSLGTLKSLQVLNLANNKFSQTIPWNLGTLSSLQKLVFLQNRLTGTLPSIIGNFSALVYLDVMQNQLTGPIPSTLGQLSKLQTLYLGNNFLSHTLPSQIGQLSSLVFLNVTQNNLIGPIPSSFGNLSSLAVLYLTQNHLTGPVPSELGNYPNIKSFNLYRNLLTGTIPTSLAQLRTVQLISLSMNRLTGTLPPSLSNLGSLFYVSIFANFLTGPIPTSFSGMTNLKFLRLHDNLLSSSLPSQLSSLTNLVYLKLNNNLLSGPLPSQYSSLVKMQLLDLSTNFLTSSLPTSLSNMSSIETLLLYDNLLSGSLPSEYSSFSVVQEVMFQHNLLIGTVPFSYSSLALARILLFFSNSLSGPIPSFLFSLPSIQVLGLSSNCFSGILPTCSSFNYSRSLQIISASDLSSGENCRIHPIPHSLSFGLELGFIPKSFIPGGVPACIFDLPSLASLYLSGNGLTGNLNGIESWDCPSSSLRRMTLSANRLTGSVPLSLQRCGVFDWLDLSMNRFSGELVSDFSLKIFPSVNTPVGTVSVTQNYFSLSVNRLSGHLPTNSNFTSLGNSVIDNVLVGNSFTFSTTHLAHSVSPISVSRLSFLNGSTSLNNGLYFAFSVIFFLTCGWFIWRNFFSQVSTSVLTKPLGFVLDQFLTSFNSYSTPPSPDVSRDPLREAKGSFLRLIRARIGFELLSTIAGLQCIVLIPSTLAIVFLVTLFKASPLSSQFSSKSSQYAWILSTNFLHGAVPVGCFLFIALVSTLVVLRHILLASRLAKLQPQFFGKSSTKFLHRRTLFLVSLLLLDVVIMFGVNALYLTIVLDEGKNVGLYQFLLGLFKSSWNGLMLSLGKQLIDSFSIWWWFGVFILSFNIVTTPSISTLLTEHNCLYPLFKQSSLPSLQIQFPFCAIFSFSLNPFTLHCQIPGYQTLQLPVISPPFIYNYQCASALVVDYAPVLIYATLFSGVLWPILLASYEFLEEGGAVEKFVSFFPSYSPFPLFSPSNAQEEIDNPLSSSATSTLSTSPTSTSSETTSQHQQQQQQQQHKLLIYYRSKLFNMVTMLTATFVDLILIFTFGLACPYLGWIISFSSIFRIKVFHWLYTRLEERMLGLRRPPYFYQQNITSDVSLESTQPPPTGLLSVLLAVQSERHDGDKTSLSEFGVELKTLAQSPSLSFSQPSELSHPDILLTRFFSGYALHDYLPAMFLVLCSISGLFWSFQAFDMVGDELNEMAGIAALATTLVLFFLVWSFLLFLFRRIDRFQSYLN